MNIKKQFTTHGLNRIKERTNINENDFKMLSRYAVKNGISLNQIPQGELNKFVASKVAVKNKRVKLYRGYVFILNKNSYRLITCYPIPDNLLEEYYKIKRMLK